MLQDVKGARSDDKMEKRVDTLGEAIKNDLSEVLELQGISEPIVKVSHDPRLSVLQGARILMALSSSDKMYKTYEQYQEDGPDRSLPIPF